MLFTRLGGQSLPFARKFSRVVPSASVRNCQVVPLLRRFSTAEKVVDEAVNTATSKTSFRTYLMFGAGFGCGAMQYFYGSKEDYYDYRFITNKNPADLQEFYGTEEFMEIFCVLPFMVTMMMRFGEFDDEGTVHAYGFPGKMEVSMIFDEEEIDTTGDGEPDTVAFFNKRERFLDHSAIFPSLIWWDMVQNFGYHRRSDGTCEVYHHGEYFRGPWPLHLFWLAHAKYVGWATEKHVNSAKFGSEDEADQEEEENQRRIVPLFVFKEFLSELADEVKVAQVLAINNGDSLAEKNHEEVIEKLKEIAAKNEEQAHVQVSGSGKRQHLALDIEDKETKAAIKQALDATSRNKESLQNLLTHPEVHK